MPTVSLAKPKMSRRTKKYPALTKEQQSLVAEHKWIAGRLAHGAKCLTGGQTGSLTREDLESIANFALCVSATRYNTGLGIKFSTYAWGTARGYIQHALRDYSRMVRTPRFIATYKNEVVRMLSAGKSYDEMAEELGITESKAMLCHLSLNNYHISYDSQPEDWVSPEFVYDMDEAKCTLLSDDLRTEIQNITEPEMTMLMKYIEDAPMTDAERELAAEKFYELQAIAHGQDTEV